MSRIKADHLAREAIVYVRQSTIDQVINNVESRRRQYGLVERARQLGWANGSVIDDDLGRSGSGVCRPGFEKLLAAICEGRVGAVVSIEASRLARNGRDWHTLLEFCCLVGTLIADEDGVYDPRLANDRLLLGMKGTMSEMELSILRQRAHEALKQKARRGELFTTVAVGYVRSGPDRIDRDPDLRVREALALVFRKFVELQSVRQVHLWFRQERIALPAVRHGVEGRRLEWKSPVYNTIHHILTNPIYAGAYAYGRSISKTRIENGRKCVTRGLRVERPEWDVLIRDHHEGYIGWDAFERNQRLIKDNANGKSWASRGAVRRGEALLAGLFRCGHCGRKLHVAYGGTKGDVARYHCRGASINHGTERCISFGHEFPLPVVFPARFRAAAIAMSGICRAIARTNSTTSASTCQRCCPVRVPTHPQSGVIFARPADDEIEAVVLHPHDDLLDQHADDTFACRYGRPFRMPGALDVGAKPE